MVWRSVPAQLAKENRKFIYGVIKEGARAKDFELAIEWLIDAGLIYKVNRVKKVEYLYRPTKIFPHSNVYARHRINGSNERTPPTSIIGRQCFIYRL